MVLFLLQITPSVQQRREVLEILHHVEGPISVNFECVACAVYERANDAQEILYMELWKTIDAVHHHIQSSIFAKILAAMDMSSVQPEIHFYKITESWGLDLVKAIRNQRQSIKFPED